MAQLVKMTGKEKPGTMTIKLQDNIPVFAAININIEDTADGYKWDSLVLPEYALINIYNANNPLKYKIFTTHIIKAYYDDNDAAAILANYLSDQTNIKYKKEFDEYQAIRTIAKTVANNIVSTGIF
jgi:hypothetical protein